jgi:hypothetical protein
MTKKDFGLIAKAFNLKKFKSKEMFQAREELITSMISMLMWNCPKFDACKFAEACNKED